MSPKKHGWNAIDSFEIEIDFSKKCKLIVRSCFHNLFEIQLRPKESGADF